VSSVYIACLELQRDLDADGVDADIGCDSTGTPIVRPCIEADQDDPPLDLDDVSDARSAAEHVYGGTLPMPEVMPAWVDRFGAAPVPLYSPRYVDGDPTFYDGLRDPRPGATVVLAGSETGSPRVRITFAPLPDCWTGAALQTRGGVDVTYTWEGRPVGSGSSFRYFEVVTGGFILPDVAVRLELVYDRDGAPSEDARTIEFLDWAERIIDADASS
jgi:hypothetical protein